MCLWVLWYGKACLYLSEGSGTQDAVQVRYKLLTVENIYSSGKPTWFIWSQEEVSSQINPRVADSLPHLRLQYPGSTMRPLQKRDCVNLKRHTADPSEKMNLGHGGPGPRKPQIQATILFLPQNTFFFQTRKPRFLCCRITHERSYI